MTTIEELVELAKQPYPLSVRDIAVKAVVELGALNHELEALTRQFSSIDKVLARRPALDDCNTRLDKIEKAITVAKTADDLTRQVEELTKERDELRQNLLSISAGLYREFDESKGDKCSGDLLDDFACFMEHHKAKETLLTFSQAKVAEMREALLVADKYIGSSDADQTQGIAPHYDVVVAAINKALSTSGSQLLEELPESGDEGFEKFFSETDSKGNQFPRALSSFARSVWQAALAYERSKPK